MTSAIQERMLEETDRKCDWVGTRWCMVQEVLTGYTSRSIIDNDKDHFINYSDINKTNRKRAVEGPR